MSDKNEMPNDNNPAITKNGYQLFDIISLLQKSIRRGDVKLASWCAMELCESGHSAFAWKRLLIISAEDCSNFDKDGNFHPLTVELLALKHVFDELSQKKNIHKPYKLHLAKAAILLAKTAHNREVDHSIAIGHSDLLNMKIITKEMINEAISQINENERISEIDIPDYCYDCHTIKGKKLGRNTNDFVKDEWEALANRLPDVFDKELEKLFPK